MNLDDWRSRINDLDNQLLNLLNQRAEAALRIGDLKRRKDLAYFVPEREAEIVDRLVKDNGGPLPAAAVRAIWREVLSASLALERPLRVAYLGPVATFTHQAALQRFGSLAEFQPARTILDVFEDVERNRAEYGVVPVENSTEGAVSLTLDRLIDSDVLLCGEVRLEVAQHLLSRAPDLHQIKTVCSHPQALAQCRAWLAARARPRPRAVRGRAAEPHEDRVPPDQAPAVGVRHVRRLRRPSRHVGGRGCARADPRARAVLQDSRLVSGRIRRAHAHPVGIVSQPAHPRDCSLRAGQADRGARARAWHPRRDQAGLQRKSAAAIRTRAEGHRGRA